MYTEYKYKRIDRIDTPLQGVLNSAKERKQLLYKQLKLLRQRKKNAGLHSMSYTLDIIRINDLHNECQLQIRETKKMIEAAANRLGFTTVKKGVK